MQAVLGCGRLDVVSIAIPNRLQKRKPIAALPAGFPVPCQQLVARSMEAKGTLAAKRPTRPRLMVGFGLRIPV
ncbi:MAG: hypothetical protein N2109_00205 [Fimbriimonadales bacterium]|nr:hypothetical protein [Fimbriimonadales bacterium]